MTRHHARLLGVLALFAGAAIAAGCSDDDSTSCKPAIVLDLRNGTWEVIDTVAFSGTDTTCFPDSGIVNPDTVIVEAYVDTISQCELNPWGDPDSPDLCCESTVNGNAVDINCRSTYPLDVCELVFEVTAVGTVTDTTWDLTLRYLDTISGPENPCVFFEGYRDTCLTTIRSIGRWISADGDTACLPLARTGDDILRAVLARSKARLTR